MKRILLICVLCLVTGYWLSCESGERPTTSSQPKDLTGIARDIIRAARYCSLVTLDENGHPRARVMDAFSPEAGMVIWFGTTAHSRKVAEIRNDPRVTLLYFDPVGVSYVTLRGTAEVVEDPAVKRRWWKEEWKDYYPDIKDYLPIRVIPESMEVISETHGIQGDPHAWTPPEVQFRLYKKK